MICEILNKIYFRAPLKIFFKVCSTLREVRKVCSLSDSHIAFAAGLSRHPRSAIYGHGASAQRLISDHMQRLVEETKAWIPSREHHMFVHTSPDASTLRPSFCRFATGDARSSSELSFSKSRMHCSANVGADTCTTANAKQQVRNAQARNNPKQTTSGCLVLWSSCVYCVFLFFLERVVWFVQRI